MLVCSVSLRPPRTAIAADVVEVATAADEAANGQVVFATLVDDPASVLDRVDAYLGQIMAEAANAAATVNAGLTYVAGIVEAGNATSVQGAAVPTIHTVAVVEAATATTTQDAAIAAATARFEGAVATGPLLSAKALPPIVIYLDEMDPR